MKTYIIKVLLLFLLTFSLQNLFAQCSVQITGYSPNNCRNQALTLIAAVQLSSGGHLDSIKWSNNNVTNTINYTPQTQDTTFWVIAYFTGCSNSSDSDTAQIHSTPVQIGTFNVSPAEICNGGSVTLSATTNPGTGSGIFQYDWIRTTNTADTNLFIRTSTNQNNSYTDNTINQPTGGDEYYRLELIDIGCPAPPPHDTIRSAWEMVTIKQDPSATITPPDDNITLCPSSNPLRTLSVINQTGGLTNQIWYWEIHYPNGDIIDATTTTCNITGDTIHGYGEIYVLYKTDMNSSLGCDAYSDTVNYKLIHQPTHNITTPTINQLCEIPNFTPTLTSTFTNPDDSIPGSYEWLSKFDNLNYTLISGATTFSLTQTSNIIGYYSLIYQNRFIPTIGSSLGCNADSCFFNFTIHKQPFASISSLYPDYCEGGQVSLTIDSFSGGAGTPAYIWNVIDVSGDTSLHSNVDSALIASVTTNDSLVQLIYQNDPGPLSGCAADTSEIQLHIHPDPVVHAGTTPSTDTICNNSVINLYGNSVTDGIPGYAYTWNWEQLDSLNGTWSQIGVAQNYSGTLYVPTASSEQQTAILFRASVASDPIHGCYSDSSSTTTVVINPTPLITGVFNNNDTLCSGASFPFSLTASSPNSTFSWHLGTLPSGISSDVSSGSGGSASFVLTNVSSVIGSVQLFAKATGTQPPGCVGPDTLVRTIQVVPLPAPATFSVSPSTTVCAKTQNLFIAVDTIPDITYQWLLADPSVIRFDPDRDTTFGSFAMLDFPGSNDTSNISVTAVNAQGCRSEAKTYSFVITSDSIDLNNTALDANDLILSKSLGNTLICLKNDVDGYQWGRDHGPEYYPEELPDSVYQSISLGSNFDSLITNNYYWVILKDGVCRTKVYYRALHNLPPYDNGRITPPLAYSDLQPEVLAYPNPSSGWISLSLKGFSGHTVYYTVYNSIGKLVLKGSYPLNYNPDFHCTLDLSGLRFGLYYLQLESSQGQTGSSHIALQ